MYQYVSLVVLFFQSKMPVLKIWSANREIKKAVSVMELTTEKNIEKGMFK
jgi:DNA-binding protein